MPPSSSLLDLESPLRTEATTDIIGYRLRRAQLAVFQRFIAAFEALNLRPSEYSVLVLIADNPGRKQTEIAEVLGIKRANFVSLITDLEDRDLVERHVVPGNRRANALYLTSKGKAFLRKANKAQEAFEASCIERLGGAAERDKLLVLLNRLCS
jgi:DNA-binding MarR family transcriptional regulator